MDYRILGPLEVRRERDVVTLGGPKPRALLAVLLLHANEPVSADRLANDVWGEEAPARTTQNVQVTVSRLRKALGDDVVTTTPAGYRLQVRPGELDADRFEDLAKRGHEALEAGRLDEAAARLREAEGLWHGPPLADVADLPFASDEIRRLEEAQLAAMVDRVKAEAAAGEPELVPNLRRLVDQYPAHEWFAGQLMRALYRCGRQAEALAAYQDVRRHLIDEFGIEPGPKLRDLQKAILQQDPSLKLERLPDEIASAAMSRLEGRTDELETLIEQWDRAETGHGAVVAIAGAPGMGKTRITAEVAIEAQQRGAAVAYVSGRDPPAHVLRALDRARQAARPTLLVLDDVDDVAPAMPELTRALADAPTLVLATGTSLDTLACLQPSGELTLGPLGRDAVRAIVTRYVPEPEVDGPTTKALIEASGGAPRRVHELAGKWKAARDVEETAKLAAAGRDDLRRMADHLAGSVVEFQATDEQLHNGDDGPLVCPFKGLAAFEPTDAHYFCGRDRLVAELVAALVGARLLGVIGPSGSGKSSVVRAGLLPALEDGVLPGSRDWPRRIMRPGEHPSSELARVCVDVAPGARAVLVIDQFEETFTACRDEDERLRFIADLVEITEDRAGSLVVIALRADFYGRCAAYPKLSRLLSANQVLVGPMLPGELRQAIVRPAERVRLEVEDDLVEALVSDVKDEPGALPLLSTALLELWQRRNGRCLWLASYAQTGGVHGAVARLAEDAYGRLDERQQVLARRVFLQLAEVEPEGGVERRRLPLAELCAEGPGDVESVIGRLADARLLTISSGAVEFAHEALLREWPRLSGWIEDDREDLRVHRNLSVATDEWQRHGRDDDALYRGARLAEAREWAKRADRGPTQAEAEFLATSEERATRERTARRRRIRIAFAGLGVALAAITAVAIAAVYQGREAERQRDIAVSRQLAATATNALESDPATGLTLALRAVDAARTHEAEEVLRQAAVEAQTLAILRGHRGRVTQASFAPDGRQAVSSGFDGTVRIWDAQRYRLLRTVPGHDGIVHQATFSPDGKRIASAGEDGTVAVMDAQDGGRRVVLRLDGVPFRDVDFSPDGARVVAGSEAGDLYIASAEKGGAPRIVSGHRGPVTAVDFSPDGSRIVSGDLAGQIRVSDLASDSVQAMSGSQFGVTSVAFGSDGRTIVSTGFDDDRVRIRDADSGAALAALKDPSGPVATAATSVDGRSIVDGGPNGTVSVWDVATKAQIAALRGHRGDVMGVGFSPTGDRMISAGDDGTVRIWRRPSQRVFPAVTSVFGAALSSDARRILVWGFGGISLVDASDGSVETRLSAETTSAAAISRDGRQVIGGGERFIRVWSAAAGPAPTSLPAPTQQINGAAFSPDGGRAVTAGEDGRLIVWSIAHRRAIAVMRLTGRVSAAAFSPDGRQVVSAGADGVARVWRADRTAHPLVELKGNGRELNAVSFSFDGGRIATGAADGIVRVHSARGGDGGLALRAHVGQVIAVGFSRDGTRLASAGADGTVHIWDARTGRHVVVLMRQPGSPVLSVAFTPDGRHVMSALADDTVRVTRCEVCGSLEETLALARDRRAG